LLPVSPLRQNKIVFVEVYVFTSITQQKLLKYEMYLVNAWRHVSVVLPAIIRQTCSTDQVQLLQVRYGIP